MIVNGKYNRELFEFLDCEVFIENGKIHRVSVPKLPPISTASYIPLNKSDFNIEKLPSEDIGTMPYDSNHTIEYISKDNSSQTLYFKLAPIQAAKLKWAGRKYIIQSKEMKTDILKYFLGAIIGVLISELFSTLLN